LDIAYELILPCVAETALDATRVADYREQIQQGQTPTALALSFNDERAPSGRCVQSALVHMLLDGHHKIMAASQLGQPIQVLSFLRETAFTGIPMRSEQIRQYYEDQNVPPILLALGKTRPNTALQPTALPSRFWRRKAITQLSQLIRRVLRRAAAEG
jgi:hypothetical protein